MIDRVVGVHLSCIDFFFLGLVILSGCQIVLHFVVLFVLFLQSYPPLWDWLYIIETLNISRIFLKICIPLLFCNPFQSPLLFHFINANSFWFFTLLLTFLLYWWIFSLWNLFVLWLLRRNLSFMEWRGVFSVVSVLRRSVLRHVLPRKSILRPLLLLWILGSLLRPLIRCMIWPLMLPITQSLRQPMLRSRRRSQRWPSLVILILWLRKIFYMYIIILLRRCFMWWILWRSILRVLLRVTSFLWILLLLLLLLAMFWILWWPFIVSLIIVLGTLIWVFWSLLRRRHVDVRSWFWFVITFNLIDLLIIWLLRSSIFYSTNIPVLIGRNLPIIPIFILNLSLTSWTFTIIVVIVLL